MWKSTENEMIITILAKTIIIILLIIIIFLDIQKNENT